MKLILTLWTLFLKILIFDEAIYTDGSKNDVGTAYAVSFGNDESISFKIHPSSTIYLQLRLVQFIQRFVLQTKTIYEEVCSHLRYRLKLIHIGGEVYIFFRKDCCRQKRYHHFSLHFANIANLYPVLPT